MAEAADWQPIETAPKDGSQFEATYLDDCGLHKPYWHVAMLSFEAGSLRFCDPLERESFIRLFTHWRVFIEPGSLSNPQPPKDKAL